METKPRKVMVYENNYDYKTNKWSKSQSGIIGYFLAFGIAADEDARSSFSIAIVEMPDGTVRTAELNLIRFLQDPKI